MVDSNDSILIPKIDPVQNEQEKIAIPQVNTQNVPAEKQGSVTIQEPLVKKIEIPQTQPKKKFPLALLIVLVLVGTILLHVIPLGLFALKAKASYQKLSPLSSQIDIKNVSKLKSDLSLVKNEVSSLTSSYKLISWMRITPLLGGYISDLGHGLAATGYSLEAAEIGLTTVEPYLSVLGYNSTEVKDGGKTAQERIDFIVGAIPEIVPKAGEISEKITKAREELNNIDPNRYPEDFKGKNVREMLKKGLDLFDQAAFYVSQSKPLLEVAPFLLGIDEEREYLVLFQNDKELRATGGFLTAYSIMKVKDARFDPVASADIYHLDAKYKPILPAPQPIVDLIKGPYVISQNIRLRDINYNPDFEESMKAFETEAKKVGISGIDGIIGVDTGLLVNILDVLGPIGVPGFGNFSTKIEPKCNCPQVIYELESFADNEGPIVWDPVSGKIVYTPPNYDNRKKIIGPLMNSIMANALGQPKEKLPDLFNAVFKSLIEKHVMLYVTDEKAQAAITAFGIGGKVRDYQGDYLMIVDSNLGGRKSNLYATSEVEQEYEVEKDGSIVKTVNITYKNPVKQDGWLNSVLPNWVRIYVPQGSTLITSEGLEKTYETTEELGKTVFSGYFQLRPEGVSKVTFQYKLPKRSLADFKILIQKQPGTYEPLYVLRSTKTEEEFYLNTDKEIRVKF